jgi:hypothetical protein
MEIKSYQFKSISENESGQAHITGMTKLPMNCASNRKMSPIAAWRTSFARAFGAVGTTKPTYQARIDQ